MKLLFMMLIIFSAGSALITAQKARSPHATATRTDETPKIESNYDRFKDRTTLSFSRTVFGSDKNPPVLLLAIGTVFDGQTAPHQIPQTFALSLVIIGGTERTRDPELLAILDGERLTFRQPKFSSINFEGVQTERFGTTTDPTMLSKIAEANKVEMRFGDMEFVLDSAYRQAIRNLLNRFQ